MLLDRLRPRDGIAIAVGFLGLHALSVAVLRAHVLWGSYPFEIAAPALALGVCVWRARQSRAQTRLAWSMLALGIALWVTGTVMAAWEDLFQHISGTSTYPSDFAYFLYGVPVLLAISWPMEGERIGLFLWLDAVQAAVTAWLIYGTIFLVFPFTHVPPQPIEAAVLIKSYNVENLLLALAATVRLLAGGGDAGMRRFFKVLTMYLWVYAICIGAYNELVMVIGEETGIFDLMSDVPMLFLAAAAVGMPAGSGAGRGERDTGSQRRTRGRTVELYIESVSPIFYTVALLALGFGMMRRYFYMGIVAVLVALAVYAIRATVLQNRYRQAQDDLGEARDRLERLSLTDGLTGVANRRAFDHTLETEWTRTVRSQTPLSLLMVDIDHFKRVNDRYGHGYGDQCLVAVAAALSHVLARSGDLLARYGGEEFAAILVGTGRSGAEVVAEKMLETVRALRLRNEGTGDGFVTLSIGVATYEYPGEGSAAMLLEASDKGLYRAKYLGRNRVEFWEMGVDRDGEGWLGDGDEVA